MAIQFVGGKILFVGGAIAMDPKCCCAGSTCSLCNPGSLPSGMTLHLPLINCYRSPDNGTTWTLVGSFAAMNKYYALSNFASKSYRGDSGGCYLFDELASFTYAWENTTYTWYLYFSFGIGTYWGEVKQGPTAEVAMDGFFSGWITPLDTRSSTPFDCGFTELSLTDMFQSHNVAKIVPAGTITIEAVE